MTSAVESFVKNMTLVAPGKGEAKKTISRGLIRVSVVISGAAIVISGLATDDVMSVYQELLLPTDEAQSLLPKSIFEQIFHEDFVGWFTPEQLKNWEEPTVEMDQKFDEKFWVEHVYSSIHDNFVLDIPATGITVNPDRLRKFSLMEPRGQALNFHFVEWADQSIIQWSLGGSVHGSYAPIDMEV